MKMNKMMNGLLYVDSHDSLVRVLQSWRLWIVGALIGAILATGIYAVFPPVWRARAVVVVDHNVEEVWEIPAPRQFYFLGREARKLQELAFSDETLGLLADEVGGVSIGELRGEILYLSQPNDGGWHFFADHPDPVRAEEIASAWATIFYRQVLDKMEVSLELEIMRKEISAIMEKYPDMSSGEAAAVFEGMHPGLERSRGISPYLELYLAQVENLLVVRKVPLSLYILIGSLVGACGLAFYSLATLRTVEQDVFLVD